MNGYPGKVIETSLGAASRGAPLWSGTCRADSGLAVSPFGLRRSRRSTRSLPHHRSSPGLRWMRLRPWRHESEGPPHTTPRRGKGQPPIRIESSERCIACSALDPFKNIDRADLSVECRRPRAARHERWHGKPPRSEPLPRVSHEPAGSDAPPRQWRPDLAGRCPASAHRGRCACPPRCRPRADRSRLRLSMIADRLLNPWLDLDHELLRSLEIRGNDRSRCMPAGTSVGTPSCNGRSTSASAPGSLREGVDSPRSDWPGIEQNLEGRRSPRVPVVGCW